MMPTRSKETDAVVVVTRGLSEEEVEDLREAFSHFDANGDGSVSLTELSVVLRSLGYSPTSEQLRKLMDKVATPALSFNASRPSLCSFETNYDTVLRTIYLCLIARAPSQRNLGRQVPVPASHHWGVMSGFYIPLVFLLLQSRSICRTTSIQGTVMDVVRKL